jgi:hypothetical protein
MIITGEQIDQLALRVNLGQTLAQQFANTQRTAPGRTVTENIFPRLQERHFIHKVPASGKKITTAEEVCDRGDTRSCCLQMSGYVWRNI